MDHMTNLSGREVGTLQSVEVRNHLVRFTLMAVPEFTKSILVLDDGGNEIDQRAIDFSIDAGSVHSASLDGLLALYFRKLLNDLAEKPLESE